MGSHRPSSPLAALFRREIRIARSIGGGGGMGVVFFLILVSLTPFAIGPDMNLLASIGPAILWIAALLATLLGLDRLFQGDADDGSLDLFTMSATPLELVVLVKCAAHWGLTALPLIVAAPVLGLTLGLEPSALAGVAASLLAGTPALTAGAGGAVATVCRTGRGRTSRVGQCRHDPGGPGWGGLGPGGGGGGFTMIVPPCQLHP